MSHCRERLLALVLAGLLVGLAVPSAQTAPVPDFKLGVLLPHSGVFARLGESMTQGLEMYFESIHWTAGGRRIILVKEDEGAPAPDIAVRKFRKLVEQDRVDMVTGIVSSSSLGVLLDPIRETRTVTVVANAGFDAATREKRSPYLLRTSFTNWQISAAGGEWAAATLGKRAVALAADFQGGYDNVRAFRDTYEPAGGRIVQEVHYPVGNPDFAPHLARVRLAMQNADLVFCFAGGADAVRLVRQWKEYGMQSFPILCNGQAVGDDVLPAVGDAAEGFYGALPWLSTLGYPENRRFSNAYRARYGRGPDAYSAQAYETAVFIAEALKRVQGDTSNQRRLIETMKAVTFRGPRGTFKLDPETQNVILTMYLFRAVREGDTIVPRILKVIRNWKDPGKTP